MFPYCSETNGPSSSWPIKSRNLLMAGKCYHKLKDVDNAAKYLKKVQGSTARTKDDEEAKEEAVSLLKQLGVKL